MSDAFSDIGEVKAGFETPVPALFSPKGQHPIFGHGQLASMAVARHMEAPTRPSGMKIEVPHYNNG
jgi:hypothetical protein